MSWWRNIMVLNIMYFKPKLVTINKHKNIKLTMWYLNIETT